VHGLRAEDPKPAIPGYANYETFVSRLDEWAKGPHVERRSLAKTLEGRDVWLLTIGRGENRDHKPAILIVGQVEAPHMLGSEVTERMAKRLVEGAADDETISKLLDEVTLYIIPRPSPDAVEAFFTRPYREKTGNARVTNDDRDRQVAEDGFEDLDGDGFITQMRIEDATGKWIPHPNDDRLMIEADASKGELGRYRLLSEGIDNDGDEQWNEDPGDGVSFNRNWTYQYPVFERQAGEYQVSEPETRAVADFAFDHPNIVAVFCFSPEDNLFHPWKGDGKAEGERIKTHVYPEDATTLEPLLKRYREIHGGENAPASPDGKGSFSEWAYFHFGRPTFAARGWWIPKVEAKPAEDPKPADAPKDDAVAEPNAEAKPEDDKKPEEEPKPEGDKKPQGEAKPAEEDKRAERERQALAWFEQEKVEGFSAWTAIEHPDFAGQKVEVGGFRPFFQLNPPAPVLDELAEKHTTFLVEMASWFPKLEIASIQVKSLGGNVFEVKATVRNTGRWPTSSKMGEATRNAYPLQVEIGLPEGASLVTGSVRTTLSRLAASGGQADHTWLVLAPNAESREIRISVSAPAVGQATQTRELK
jgi:hypothetical protein